MARPQHGGMRDMTVGSPAKQILLFTLPLLAGNFLQQLYNMVDSWVVGNYVSDAALAAVGTVISQAFSWLFGLFYINRHFPELRIRLFRSKLEKALFREIVRIGLPAGLQMSMVSLGTMAILSKVNSFGKAFTAGMNVGNKLDSLAFLPTQSLAAGITAFVGQNMGAGREDRAHQGIRATVLAADVWTVFTAVVLCLFSEGFIGLFSPDAPVIAAGSYYLRCVMPPYVLFATLFVLNAAMRGAGDSVFPMLNVAASLILIRVPAVYLLADHFGPQVMFWGYGIGWGLGCGLSVWYYVTGRWKRRFRPPERRAPESPPEGEM